MFQQTKFHLHIHEITFHNSHFQRLKYYKFIFQLWKFKIKNLKHKIIKKIEWFNYYILAMSIKL